MTRPDHAINAYLEGQLTDEQARAIDSWIAADPANAKALLHLARTHQTLVSIGKERSLSRQAAEVKPDQLDPVTLASLAEMEAAAEPIPFEALDQPFAFDPKAKRQANSDSSLAQALDDLRWAAGKVATKFIRSPYGITGVIAALLLIGVYLFAPFSSTDPAPSQDIADNTSPDKPAESAQPIPRDTPGIAPETQPVATLTNTHNAVWGSPQAEGASAPGSYLTLTPGTKLHPNQRLHLTAGFAEITTNDGAIAILEAPATIELLDNDNALRLPSGKLVGICETESSKGFLVRTPHLDITDLGTRFGIDSTSFATEVHVFEGEVQAERSSAPADTKPITLAANQSARTTADSHIITSIDYDTKPFAAVLPRTVQVPGSGHGLAVGDTDPNWQIVAIDGNPLQTPQAVQADGHEVYYEYFPRDPATSQFVTWTPDREPPVGGFISYTFQTEVTLPFKFNPDATPLKARFIADNEVAAVIVNGKQIAIKDDVFTFRYDRWVELVIDDHLVAGTNTIAFEVRNHLFKEFSKAAAVGLRVEWTLRTNSRFPDNPASAP